jgi:hypothetical protein
MRLAAIGSLSATVLGTAGCVAAAPLVTNGWLVQMTAGLAANVIATSASEVLPALWESWMTTLKSAQDAEKAKGFNTLSDTCAQDTVPALFFSSSVAAGDPATDRLLFCLTDSDSAAKVEFEPWAWQSVFLFAKKVAEGKSGDDLAMVQAMCGMSLIPSGVTSAWATQSGKTQVLEYPTRNGFVELNKTIAQDGVAKVRVTANGMPSGNGSARSELIDLPTF